MASGSLGAVFFTYETKSEIVFNLLVIGLCLGSPPSRVERLFTRLLAFGATM